MNKNIRKNQIINAWRLLEKKTFRTEKWTAFRFEHIATGAEYLHIDNDSKDKAIAITFKTCPGDHTGVAHILEHTVLTGSGKYPVRDPFFSMIKNSLQTFMNAFTAEDWTAYLFSSQYDDDLANLLSVYLDAVYYPKLSYLNFRQEGWRYEYQDNQLSYAGVVYNEMKGALSSPKQLMDEYMKAGLFPESLYRFNSGGRVDKIPNLDFESFKDFHRNYYHPSNTLFYSYGPIKLEEILGFINDKALKNFKKKIIKADIKKEPRFKKPKKSIKYFPANSNNAKEVQFLSAWLAKPTADLRDTLLLELISNLLIGEASSPLKKTLLASGFGADLADGSGVNADYKDAIFACGLKGLDQKDVSQVKRLLDRELKKICRDGFSAQVIKAALNKMEFKYREINNQPYPYGIKLYLNLITPWRHRGKVMDCISLREHFVYFQKQIKVKGYIEKNIKKLIINNKHRLDLEFRPDKDLAGRQLREEVKVLKRHEAKLSQKERDEIIQENIELDKLQNTEEDLSCLPDLPLASIPKEIQITKAIILDKNIIAYPKKTKGFAYTNLAFSLDLLEERELFFLPLLSYVLIRLGTKNKSDEEFIRAVNTYTGGINFFPWLEIARGKKLRASMFVRGKALNKEWPKLIGLIKELIETADFSKSEQIFQYAKEVEAKMTASLVEQGHHYALSLSARGLSSARKVQEEWFGITQIKFLRDLIKNNNKKKLAKDLSDLAEKIFGSKRSKISLIAEPEKIEPFAKSLDALNGESKANKRLSRSMTNIEFKVNKHFEAYQVNTAASFVAMSARVIDIYHPDSPALMAAIKLLSRNQVHNLVREQGGAYGGFVFYDYYSSLVQFGSYRDPHVRRTLSSFKKAVRLLINNQISPDDLKSAQLMVIADMNKPLSPAEAGEQAFYHHLLGNSQAHRQKFRNKILKLSAEDIIRAATKYLLLSSQHASVAVISSPEKLAKINQIGRGKRFKINRFML
ncbi:MAG: insulinase family protein [Patescibacteria group bacterium]|nr:insulinase family protein [Patescibacteria group bacterium]